MLNITIAKPSKINVAVLLTILSMLIISIFQIRNMMTAINVRLSNVMTIPMIFFIFSIFKIYPATLSF